MNLPGKKILFISHDATRTGAPILLKHHLQGFKKQYPDFAFDIMLKSGGELQIDFEQIGNVIKTPAQIIRYGFFDRLFKQPERSLHKLEKSLTENYDTVYGNTVVTADLLMIAKKAKPGVVTVCHVHELEIAIKQFFNEVKFREAIPYINHFVAASKAVVNVLVDQYNIPKEKIVLHYEYIPMTKNTSSRGVLNKPGLRICGCGTLDWRKGIDIFIQSAAKLKGDNPNKQFHFYWIGGTKSSIEYAKAMYDIKRLGIEDSITIIENCPDPLNYIGACDVFLLSSREDPFPLVCLEAASLGKPIVCFKQAGGMEEFIDDETGWLIDYLDLDALNQLFSNLLKYENLDEILLAKGNAAKARAQNFDIAIGVDKLKLFLDKITTDK